MLSFADAVATEASTAQPSASLIASDARSKRFASAASPGSAS